MFQKGSKMEKVTEIIHLQVFRKIIREDKELK